LFHGAPLCLFFLGLDMGRAKIVKKSEHFRMWKNRLDRTKEIGPVTIKPSEMKYLENCTYWRTTPPFEDRWQKRKPLRDGFRTLHDFHDMRCTPKPAGPMTRLGTLDTTAVVEKLRAGGDEIWREDEFRQKKYRVHNETESIVLIWKQKIFGKVAVSPAWAEWKPLLQPAISAVCNYFGYDADEVQIWKAMLTRLAPGMSVKPHEDLAEALAFPHRIHWVISGERGVRTLIGDDELSIVDGELFEFNNIRLHSVSNGGEDFRVHAIFDIMPKKLSDDARLVNYSSEGDYYYEKVEEEITLKGHGATAEL